MDTENVYQIRQYQCLKLRYSSSKFPTCDLASSRRPWVLGKCQGCSVLLVKHLSCVCSPLCPWSGFSSDTPWSNCETNVYLQWEQPTGYRSRGSTGFMLRPWVPWGGRTVSLLTLCLPLRAPVMPLSCFLGNVYGECGCLPGWTGPQAYDSASLLQVSSWLWGWGSPIIKPCWDGLKSHVLRDSWWKTNGADVYG